MGMRGVFEFRGPLFEEAYKVNSGRPTLIQHVRGVLKEMERSYGSYRKDEGETLFSELWEVETGQLFAELHWKEGRWQWVWMEQMPRPVPELEPLWESEGNSTSASG